MFELSKKYTSLHNPKSGLWKFLYLVQYDIDNISSQGKPQLNISWKAVSDSIF